VLRIRLTSPLAGYIAGAHFAWGYTFDDSKMAVPHVQYATGTTMFRDDTLAAKPVQYVTGMKMFKKMFCMT